MQALTMPRRTVGVVLLAIGAGGLVLAGPLPHAHAGSSFTVTAAATGLEITSTSDGYPLSNQPFDATFPQAQVKSSTTGQESFAAYPYPGSTPASLPGLVAGLLASSGVHLPTAVPSYPLAASQMCNGNSASTTVPDGSSVGTAPASLPYALTASCSKTAATADAHTGIASSAGGQAAKGLYVSTHASASQSRNGSISAYASSEVTGLDVAGVIRFAPVTSRAAITKAPKRGIQRSSSLSLVTFTVAGVTATIGPSGIMVGGSSTALVTGAVTTALRANGVTLTYLGSRKSKDGITSAGLQIDVTKPLPGNGTPATTSFIVGQVTAHGSLLTFDDGGSPTTGSGKTSPTAAPGKTGGGSTSSGGTPIRSSGVGTGPASVGSGSQSAPDVAGPASANGPIPQLASEGADAKISTLSFYLVLVFAGLLLLGSGSVARLLGVRLLWTR